MCVVDVGAIEIVKCAYFEKNLYEIRVACAELLKEKADTILLHHVLV